MYPHNPMATMAVGPVGRYLSHPRTLSSGGTTRQLDLTPNPHTEIRVVSAGSSGAYLGPIAASFVAYLV